MSCPAVCACRLDDDDKFDFKNCDFTYATAKPRWRGREFLDGQIIGHANLDNKSDNLDRYIHLSNITLDLIGDVYDIGDKLSFAIEEYAFSKSGQLASLGENGGVLKYRVYEEYNAYIKPYSSLSIKAFARLALPLDRQTVGKLKLKMTKEEMHQAFIADTGVDLCKIFDVPSVLTDSGQPIAGNPISDIVDAYWVAKYHYNQLKGK